MGHLSEKLSAGKTGRMDKKRKKLAKITEKGGGTMEMTIHDDQKIVEIWLTNGEKNDPHIRQNLKPIYNQYRDSPYMVAVFESGGGDLYDHTLEILKYNRNKMAENEIKQEKKQTKIDISS